MSHVPPPPLTPEERALADALARLDAPAAPSARLDAAIRAAARDALAPAAGAWRPGSDAPSHVGSAHPAATPAPATLPRARRRPRRWAASMGIAASVALAVGVAWQLRPLPSDTVAYDEAPPTLERARTTSQDTPGAAGASPAAPAAAASAAAPAVTGAPPAAPDATQDAASEIAEAPGSAQAPAPVPAPAPAAAPPAQPQEAPVVFDNPSPMDRPVPPPAEATGASSAATQRGAAPPPAPPAPPSSATDAIVVTGSRIAAPDPRPAGRAERAVPAVELDRDPWHDDQPLDDQPPASFDTPDVRDAWLARIRELRDDGQLAPARASLAEFRRRYPDVALPDDLRPLLD